MQTLSTARALTIKQPWASLIACGAKSVENRSWPIPASWSPTGPLLIHAGRGVDRSAWEQLTVRQDLTKRGAPTELPHGVILAVVGIVTCHQAKWGCCAEPYAQAGNGWHWVLRDLRALPRPVPATGRLGLWRPGTGLLAEVEAQYTEMEVAW